MRNILRQILSILAIPLIFNSCSESYYIENNLHGVWQVVLIEEKSTNKISEGKGELYYMFQRSMVQLCYKDLNVPEAMTRYIAHFDIVSSDSIKMGGFRFYSTGEGEQMNKEDEVAVESLRKFGLYQDYTTFYMEQSKQKLILTSDSALIELRRY